MRVPPLALPPLPDSAILGSLSGAEFNRVAGEAARTAPPRENGGLGLRDVVDGASIGRTRHLQALRDSRRAATGLNEAFS